MTIAPPAPPGPSLTLGVTCAVARQEVLDWCRGAGFADARLARRACALRDRRVPTKPAEDGEEDRADLLVVEGTLLAGALGDEAVADHRLRRAEERRRHRRVAQLRRERPVALAAADQHEQQVLELHEALRQKDLVRRAA